jgi:hypothetical protein
MMLGGSFNSILAHGQICWPAKDNLIERVLVKVRAELERNALDCGPCVIASARCTCWS